MFSYHTHTEFCDGKSTIKEFCEKAVELKMESIAFTSHASVPFENSFSLAFEKIYDYRNAVLNAREIYKDININIGLEADYVPGETISFNEWRRLLNLDFVVGSVHLVKNDDNGGKWFVDGAAENYHKGLKTVFNGDIKKAVKAYFNQVREMIEIENPDIIGHFDKVKMNNQGLYFDINEEWYKKEINDTIEVIQTHNVIVEINSRGLYKKRFDDTFPGKYEILECVKQGIPLTLASDSHSIDDLDKGFNLSLKTAQNAGVKKISVYNGKEWESKSIKNFIK